VRILILGATGMLGSAVLGFFKQRNEHEIWGAIRNPEMKRHLPPVTHDRIYAGLDVLDQDALVDIMQKIRPDVVINCVGLIKQLKNADDPLSVLPINAMLPHRLEKLCALAGARLVHVSTDCVYSGKKGRYIETDLSDAEDLYGKSKFIGELHEQKHAITLRTSIIGHELNSKYALVDWFLSQENAVKGYTKAIFSGLPTVELARVIHDYVLPNPELHGLYHVSAQPIAKFDLLKLIAAQYQKNIQINPDDQVVIDRSLDSSAFTKATGYVAPDWPSLIAYMHEPR
jgi:dTDP-4-dehydrorhamnose reductase